MQAPGSPSFHEASESEQPAGSPVMLLILNCDPLPSMRNGVPPAAGAASSALINDSPIPPDVAFPIEPEEQTTPTAELKSSPYALSPSSDNAAAASDALASLHIDGATAAIARGGAGAGAGKGTSAGAGAMSKEQEREETKLWTSLYSSASAVSRVITPALAACGPTLHAMASHPGL